MVERNLQRDGNPLVDDDTTATKKLLYLTMTLRNSPKFSWKKMRYDKESKLLKRVLGNRVRLRAEENFL